MSNLRLPQETTNYIINLLHDEPRTLRQCCLISRSWVSCTRKHIFGTIRFKTSKDFEVWKKVFPDTLNLPACYTHCLGINRTKVVAVASEECSWIQPFSKVVRLEIRSCMRGSHFHLPLHLLTILKSLCPVLTGLSPSS